MITLIAKARRPLPGQRELFGADHPALTPQPVVVHAHVEHTPSGKLAVVRQHTATRRKLIEQVQVQGIARTLAEVSAAHAAETKAIMQAPPGSWFVANKKNLPLVGMVPKLRGRWTAELVAGDQFWRNERGDYVHAQRFVESIGLTRKDIRPPAPAPQQPEDAKRVKNAKRNKKTTCYRVQPIGLELGDHRSETSNDEADRGVHVFGSVSELSGGVQGWYKQTWKPEIVEIECEAKALADNGDYEGYVLVGNRGEIVRRKAFKNWDALIAWAKQYPETLAPAPQQRVKNAAKLEAAADRLEAAANESMGRDRLTNTHRRSEMAASAVDIPGFFPTPPSLVQRMLDEADIQPGMRVLEPSAGKGDIMDAVRERHPGVELHGAEIVPQLRNLLETKGHTLIGQDFLKLHNTLAGAKNWNEFHDTHGYDRIVMNPPFEKGQDIEHVLHAFTLLRPRGKLVAIMSAGPFSRSDAKSKWFREWLARQPFASKIEDLPPGTFAGNDSFRKTSVNTKLVVIEK